MAERDLETVDAIDGWIAGRGATKGCDFGVGHKAHMHQVVLDIFGQVEGHQDSLVANRQFTQQTHLINPVQPPRIGRTAENTTVLVAIQYKAKLPLAAIVVFGGYWLQTFL